jgi:membrane protease YdiL (CAAX protease family)
LVSKFIRLVLLEFFPSWEIFQWFSYDFPATFPWQALVILYACLSAALVEEIIFRGLLIPWLESRGLKVWTSVFVSALLFAGIHWCQGPVQLAHTFVFGMITGMSFATSRKLWPLILAHFFVDLVAFWP